MIAIAFVLAAFVAAVFRFDAAGIAIPSWLETITVICAWAAGILFVVAGAMVLWRIAP